MDARARGSTPNVCSMPRRVALGMALALLSGCSLRLLVGSSSVAGDGLEPTAGAAVWDGTPCDSPAMSVTEKRYRQRAACSRASAL